jgi:hypothetical protein
MVKLLNIVGDKGGRFLFQSSLHIPLNDSKIDKVPRTSL